NEIAKRRGHQLLLGFEIFKPNAADAFWAKRYTAIQTAVTTKKAAFNSMQAGYQQSTYEYQQHFAHEDLQSSAAVGSTDDRKRSFKCRLSSLGGKWTLRSGTVVEDVLFEAQQSIDELQ
ncbi:hypothetical protein BGZ75_003176, partial [Mortierella antarctica]